MSGERHDDDDDEEERMMSARLAAGRTSSGIGDVAPDESDDDDDDDDARHALAADSTWGAEEASAMAASHAAAVAETVGGKVTGVAVEKTSMENGGGNDDHHHHHRRWREERNGQSNDRGGSADGDVVQIDYWHDEDDHHHHHHDKDEDFAMNGDDPVDDVARSSSSWLMPSDLRETNIPSVTAALLASLTTGGTTYAFGLYSSELKRNLHLSQSELDTISAAFFCAGLFSWIPGLCVDTFGPRCSMSAGGILGALYLLLYWVVSTSVVHVERDLVVTALSLLGIATFMSSALVTGSVFKLIVGTCGRGTKGTAVGAAKGYVGLGSGAYACLFESLRGRGWSDLDFLPMAATFAVCAATVPALCLLEGKKDGGSGGTTKRDEATGLHFRIVYGGLIGLGIVVVGTSVMELYEDAEGGGGGGTGSGGGEGEGGGGRNLGLAALIVLMWYVPILSLPCLPTRSSRMRRHLHTALPGSETGDGDGEDDAKGEEEEEELGGLLPPSPRRRGGGGGEARPSLVAPGDSDLPTLEQRASGGMGSERSGGGDGNIEMEATTGSLLVATTTPSGGVEGDDDEGDDGGDEVHEREGLLSSPSSSSPKSATSRDFDLDDGRTGGGGGGGGRNLNLGQMLRTLPAWLLLYTTTILVGGGTVMTNNLGQMSEALRFAPDTAPAALALFSAAQAAARVLTGAASESALSNWGVGRPAFLIVASLGGCASHVLLMTNAARTEWVFVLGVTLSGMAFGMVWPLIVLIVGECFGTDNVGANYMFYDGVTSALGTLALSKFVAQEVYESHIVHYHVHGGDSNGTATAGNATEVALEAIGGGLLGGNDDDDDLTCYGEDCFRATHGIVAALSLTCVASSVALLRVTRDVYRGQ